MRIGGVVEALVAVMKTGSDEAKGEAAWALCSLAASDENMAWAFATGHPQTLFVAFKMHRLQTYSFIAPGYTFVELSVPMA